MKSSLRTKSSATNSRSFRTFLLVSQLESERIGARIAQARREAGGMTQEALAELLGLTPRSIQAYEAGDVIPYKYFKRLEEIFDRPLEWFLRGEETAENGERSLAEIQEELATEVARLRKLNDQMAKRLAEREEPRRARKRA